MKHLFFLKASIGEEQGPPWSSQKMIPLVRQWVQRWQRWVGSQVSPLAQAWKLGRGWSGSSGPAAFDCPPTPAAGQCLVPTRPCQEQQCPLRSHAGLPKQWTRGQTTLPAPPGALAGSSCPVRPVTVSHGASRAGGAVSSLKNCTQTGDEVKCLLPGTSKCCFSEWGFCSNMY